jgi:BON domain-containing protein
MKRLSPLVSLCVLAVILALGASCARKPDDARISSDIQAKFSQDSGLSGKQITVQASNGTVTLEGAVDNDAQRDAASRQAASIEGVKQVINNLQVGAMAATPASPAMKASYTPENPKPAPSKRESSRKSRRSGAARDAGNNDHAYTVDPIQNGSTEMANNTPPPAAAANTPPTPAPPPPPRKLTVDQGTQLTIRLIDAIDSEKNQTGDTFHATLNTPLAVNGEEIVPAGVDVTGHLAEVKSAGKFAGQSIVVLQLDSIASGGRTYNIQTDQYKKQGSSRGKNTAEKVGGGAAIGAIIGAIAGGGKGAAIGAAAGGGVGGGVQAATKGQQIKLPSETVLNFTLQAPVTVVQAPRPNSNRPKVGDSQ